MISTPPSIDACPPGLVEQGWKRTVRIDIDGAGEFQAARVGVYDGGVEISVVDVQHVQFVQRME
ncbi:hypothetical protein ACIQT7_12760 [Agrobacterium deltaense]